MARFAPDSSLISSYAHSVYRYKTGEIDDDGEFVYRPMSFQNDLEDITLTYGNFDILEFNPSVPEQAREAFRVKITDLDENIAQDVQDGKLDLFQFMEHIANFIHVGSKTFAPISSLPTKLSQLQNDAGYVKSSDPIQRASVADTADKLTNPVTIAITGGVTGTATAFDGSKNVSINVSTVKADKDASGNVITTTYAKKTELPDTLTDQDITDGTDDTGKLISAKKLTTYVKSIASSIDAGVKSVTTGGTNGTLNVDGVNVAVKGLGSAAYTASTAYAGKSHTHGSNEVVSMNSYVKPNEFKGAILQNDTLNVAIGKLEKALDLKEPSLSMITASELSGGTSTTERSVNAKVLSNYVVSKTNGSITGLKVNGRVITYTKADGTSSNITTQDTTYSEATTTTAGLMSSADKTKLNGIETGANKYVLPAATSTVRGGVTVGSNITNSSGAISLTKANVTTALGYTPPTQDTTYNAMSANEIKTGTGTTSRVMTAKVLSDWMLSKVPKSIGSNSKFVFTNANGTISAANFEIWVTDN